MSLGGGDCLAVCLSFPRVSGDEPKTPHALSVYDMFSPRERG